MIGLEIFEEKKVTREAILGYEELLRKQENVILGDSEVCPLKHTFADNIYVREISIPAGMMIVGKLHKHCHPNFLLEGIVDIVTESGGRERLVAPMSIISEAGTKRALQTITQCRWVTVHHNPNNTRDIVKLEKEIIAESYEQYDEFKRLQNAPKWKKLMNNIFKKRRLF